MPTRSPLAPPSPLWAAGDFTPRLRRPRPTDSGKLVHVMKWTYLLLIAAMAVSAQVRVVIDKSMAPPEWTLLERELLRTISDSMLCKREHQLTSPNNARWFTVHREPGSGDLILGMKRYAYEPSAQQPWDLGRSE